MQSIPLKPTSSSVADLFASPIPHQVNSQYEPIQLIAAPTSQETRAAAPVSPPMMPSLGGLFTMCLPAGTEQTLLSINFRLAAIAPIANFIAFGFMWWASVPGFDISLSKWLSSSIHFLSIPFAYLGWLKPGQAVVKTGGIALANRFDIHTYLLLHSLHALYAIYMSFGIPGSSGSAGAVWWEAHFSMGRPGTAVACMCSGLAWLALGLVSLGVYFRLRNC